MLYFAFGSNLYQKQMKKRCKDSKYIGCHKLKGYKLVFRHMYYGGGVADVERKRTKAKAEDLKKSFPFLKVINWGETTKSDLIINATSIGIKENTYLYQRFIEFNYPIRFKDESISVFFLKNENLPVKCEVIDEGEYLKFTKCKQ